MVEIVQYTVLFVDTYLEIELHFTCICFYCAEGAWKMYSEGA